MMEFFAQLDYWHWLILAVILIGLEILSPGVFFIWMGLAAIVVAVVLYIDPQLSWEAQLMIFAVLSIANILAARAYFKRHPIETDQPRLNRRGEQYIGRIFSLEDAMINGEGKVRVDDSTWKVRGPNCRAGETVRVIGVDGVVLLIEPAERT